MFSNEQRIDLVEFVLKFGANDYSVELNFRNGKQAGFILSLGFDCALYLDRFRKYLPIGFQVSGDWLRDRDSVVDRCDGLLAEIVFSIIDDSDGEEGRSYA